MEQIAQQVGMSMEDFIRLYDSEGPYLANETVSIYTLAAREPFTRQQTILRAGETLGGGEIIPGFVMPVAQIFA